MSNSLFSHFDRQPVLWVRVYVLPQLMWRQLPANCIRDGEHIFSGRNICHGLVKPFVDVRPPNLRTRHSLFDLVGKGARAARKLNSFKKSNFAHTDIVEPQFYSGQEPWFFARKLLWF